ncbi:uncharacterized protein LOC128982141 [Macrosteles quadrilineatus]|uniref:uncharacterized protein LOC128982141 n=1 Tax=Macrosteles quadrilineatus TaxID=74068 RepID=UPI0023E3132D|nr:uncharacterized protein LOC128982141 [Macrosteles quadrilineatus]XP_054257178.1 uncharacterized protein LOC128982141 [Macrosteles quadrilineatus]
MKKELYKLLHGFLALALILFPHGSECLQLLRVKVPPYRLKGETAVLECQYQLDGLEKLYSVKWYRENEEFYRYVPKYNPQQISYKVEGINVNHKESNDTTLTLNKVNLKTSANYRCEVSAEAPSFASVQGSGHLEVVYLPSNGPHISGERSHYMIGDEIDLNCTSGKSYPASDLYWLINDKEVTNHEFLYQHPRVVHPHGLVTTSLGLRLPAAPPLFLHGSMKVRCVASVSPVLWKGDRESVVETPLVTNREAMLLVRNTAAGDVISPTILSVLLLLTRVT